jgi:MFS family permease
VVWTVGLALLIDTVGEEGLGQAIGYVSMSISVGTLGGPLLGGVLYQNGGYYSVFGIAFGFIAIDILLRLALIERRHALPWLASEETPTASSTQISKENSSPAPDTIESPAVSVDSKPQSQETVEKASPGLLRQVTTLLKSYRLVVAFWGYFVMSLVMTSFDSVLPLFVNETFGWQQTAQGLIFIPLMVPHVLDPVIGCIIDRFPKSPRYLITAGFLAAVPFTVLLRLVTDNTMHHKILLCALLALIGVCLVTVMTPIVAEVFHAVKEIEDRSPNIFGRGGAMALAFGLSNMGFATGSLIGPFFAGFIRQSAGWGTMGWAMGLISGVTALPCLLLIGGWILKNPAPVNTEDPSDLQ